MGPLDSRHGIRELEKEARATPFFLFWAGLRSRDLRRVGPFFGRFRLRAHVHRARGGACGGNWSCGAARTLRRCLVSDVDVATAEFARISGENAREYPEADGLGALGGGKPADR